MNLCAAFLTLLVLAGGCAVGPNYQRPRYPVPEAFRGEGPGIPTQRPELPLGT